MALTGGPQGHIRLHDCTGRGHIGWKRGEVVSETNHACYARVPDVQRTLQVRHTRHAHAEHSWTSKVSIPGWKGLVNYVCKDSGFGLGNKFNSIRKLHIPGNCELKTENCGFERAAPSKFTVRFKLELDFDLEWELKLPKVQLIASKFKRRLGPQEWHFGNQNDP